MSQTRFLSIREFQKQGSNIKEFLDDDDKIIITSNGKPIGFTVGINESSFEEVLEDWKKVKEYRHLRFIDNKLDESDALAGMPDAEWIDEDDFWNEA